MITFRDFLLLEKADVTNSVAFPLKSLADKLKLQKPFNVSQALEQLKVGNILYRGVPNPKDGEFIISSFSYGVEKRNPTTTNGANLHLLLDNLPSWKKMNDSAPRNKAVICTSNLSKAREYAGERSNGVLIEPHGEPFIILPINDTRLIVCPEHDMLDAFPQLNNFGKFEGSRKINTISLAKTIGSLVANVMGKDDASIQGGVLIKSLKELTLPKLSAALEKMDSSARSNFKPFERMLEKHRTGNLFDALNSIMDPDKNGFMHEMFSKINTLPHNKEIWFNGPFVAIRLHGKITTDLQYFCNTLKLDPNIFLA